MSLTGHQRFAVVTTTMFGFCRSTDTPPKPPWPVGGVTLLEVSVLRLNFRTTPVLMPPGPAASQKVIYMLPKPSCAARKGRQLVGTPFVARPVHVAPPSLLRNRFVPVCETPTQITGVALPGVPLLGINSTNEIP